MRLVWKGREVREKMAGAAALGVERTMARSVAHAKDNHPDYPPPSEPYTRYANRTAFLTNSIQILVPAHEVGLCICGSWGSLARYALYLEIGTSWSGPTAEERAAAAGGNWDTINAPIGPKMAPRPYLRPATDIEYPLLAKRVGAAFRGQEMI